jgi:DNA-directed RNA polymerase III subunit RPC8
MKTWGRRLTCPSSDSSENLWVWKYEGQELYFDNNEMVRFRVMAEEWHDQAPSGPPEASEEEVILADSKPPYRIIGSMNGPGLGCYLWWE